MDRVVSRIFRALALLLLIGVALQAQAHGFDRQTDIRGLDEIAKVGEASEGKPLGKGDVAKKIQKDQDSDDRRNAKLAPDPNLSAGHIPKTVTDRDIKAAVTNEHLLKQLETDFEPFATAVEENKGALVMLFKTHIKDFLGI